MTDAPSEISQVVEHLVWVAHYWEDLAESRLPGTARPWRQPHLTPEQAQIRDEQAHIERLERVGVMPGEHPAPVDVGVLDTMSDILWNAVNLADEVAIYFGMPHLSPPSTAYADARPYLNFTAQYMYPELAAYAQPIAARMVDQTSKALALILDGQLLDVLCPWCHGLTAHSPAGGERTWRVRVLPGGMAAIVCEGACEPPPREVGTWWRGQPCWPVSDWEGLARRVRVGEKAAA